MLVANGGWPNLKAVSTVAIPTITVPIAAHLAAFGPASLSAVALVTNLFTYFSGIAWAGDQERTDNRRSGHRQH